MAKKGGCWGIEVGANALKAIRLESAGGEVKLAEFDVLPFKKVLTTPDLNVDEQIQLQLDLFLSRHDVSKTPVVVSVAGHMAFARFAKLPPVEKKKIPAIVKFEAVQQIPFPIDQVEWDYQVFEQEDSPDVEVGIFAITKERASQFLANYRAVGMQVEGITLSPLAVYNAMAYDLKLTPESDGVMFIDIGTVSTDVIIVEAGRIWLRTLPIGGNNFTDALVRTFKLNFHKAEKLKREAGTSKHARHIFQAMRPVFADLVQEVQRSLGFYQSLNRDAKIGRIVGLGSTFRLPGLSKFLKQQLQIEVDRPTAADDKESGFKRISVDGPQAAEFADHAMTMATAYGLALQGLGKAPVDANIMPMTILKQRMWRAKQPWFLAASIVLLAAVGAAQFHVWRDGSGWRQGFWTNNAKAYGSHTPAWYTSVKVDDKWEQMPPDEKSKRQERWKDGLATVPPQPNAVIYDAGQFVSKLEKFTQNDPRQQIDNVTGVLNYREVWPTINDDIATVLAKVAESAGLPGDKPVARKDRKRFFVLDMDAVYMDADKPPGWDEKTTVDMPGGQSGKTGSFKSQPGGGQPGEAAAPSDKPGTWLISIKGYTSFDQSGNPDPNKRASPSQVIALELIPALNELNKAKGRPYVIEAYGSDGKTGKYTCVPVKDVENNAQWTALLARFRGQQAPKQGMGGQPLMPGSGGQGGDVSASGITPQDTIEKSDSVFEIQWLVHLRPAAVYQTEPAAAPETPATPATQPAAAAVPVATEARP